MIEASGSKESASLQWLRGAGYRRPELPGHSRLRFEQASAGNRRVTRITSRNGVMSIPNFGRHVMKGGVAVDAQAKRVLAKEQRHASLGLPPHRFADTRLRVLINHS